MFAGGFRCKARPRSLWGRGPVPEGPTGLPPLCPARPAPCGKGGEEAPACCCDPSRALPLLRSTPYARQAAKRGKQLLCTFFPACDSEEAPGRFLPLPGLDRLASPTAAWLESAAQRAASHKASSLLPPPFERQRKNRRVSRYCACLAKEKKREREKRRSLEKVRADWPDSVCRFWAEVA